MPTIRPDNSYKNRLIPPSETPPKPPSKLSIHKKAKISAGAMLQFMKKTKVKVLKKMPRPQPAKCSDYKIFLNFTKKTLRELKKTLPNPPKFNISFKSTKATAKKTQTNTLTQEDLSHGYAPAKGLEKLRQAQATQEAQEIVDSHLENLEELEEQLTPGERKIHDQWKGSGEKITAVRAFSPVMVAKNDDLRALIDKSQKRPGVKDSQLIYCPLALDVLNESSPEKFQEKLLNLVKTSLDEDNSTDAINIGNSRNDVKKEILNLMNIKETDLFSTDPPEVNLKDGVNLEDHMDTIKNVIVSTFVGSPGLNHQGMWTDEILRKFQKNNPGLTLPQ